MDFGFFRPGLFDAEYVLQECQELIIRQFLEKGNDFFFVHVSHLPRFAAQRPSLSNDFGAGNAQPAEYAEPWPLDVKTVGLQSTRISLYSTMIPRK